MAYTAHKDEESLRERFDSPSELAAKVDQLASFVREAAHMVVFTGAGISTSAGIPDFRGPDGKWTREAQGKEPLRGVSTVSAFPTLTHMSLVELQARGILKYLISQNCDGLHRRSGMPGDAISELHGNSNIEVCETCGQSFFRDIACHRATRSRDHFTGRFCSRADCGGPLLEYTIDFGQNLPVAALELAEQNSRRADLHLVLGSSLTVSPACGLPQTTAKCGGRLVIVNLQRTPLDELSALRIYARTDTVMTMLMERLGVPVPPFRLRRRFVFFPNVVDDGSSPSSRKLQLRAVDVHDPSLELSLVREVDWSAALASANRSSTSTTSTMVPVTVTFTGHYREPTLCLNVDISPHAPIQDLEATYDPVAFVWSDARVQALRAPPQPSARARTQQEHGRGYAKSHFDYCVAGVAKMNPDLSKSDCVEATRLQLQRVRHTARSAPSQFRPPQMTVTLATPQPSPSPVSSSSAAGAATLAPVMRKIEISGRNGEFRKVATPQEEQAMNEHVARCDSEMCHAVWRGPWGPFIGGPDGKHYFDLTLCEEGARLNQTIGWDINNPRA
eukprot:gnl/Spiro4/6610_TR3409_c0_g1_i1.p1 gnl/Spiro4/6610_TR3409_c0_g1~~gnl/Spiro4/6610_TR3409_c0_g1_i1.p1  ORF type:complete len:573 (+),score=137.75 gnl/Spiro4/6610_TR3409_c0_g1_i1:38-1720(+)